MNMPRNFKKIVFSCSVLLSVALFLFGAWSYKRNSKENEPVLSVIVPVYNACEYLPTCLDSLLTQTYKNMEIVCIDDGSTDNSLEILNEYKEKHKNLIVLSSPHSGVSAARNEGMKNCSGTLLTFVDADDYLDANLYEKCVATIKEKNVDILTFGLMFEPNHNYGNVVSEKIFDDPFYVLENEFNNYSVCNRIFKTSIIKDNKLTFMEDVIYGEDNLFLTMVLPHAKLIANQPYVYYHYVSRETSLEKTLSTEEKLLASIKRCEYMTNYYIENNYKKAYNWLLKFCLEITYYRISELNDKPKQSRYASQVLDILDKTLLKEISNISDESQNLLYKMKNFNLI